MGQLARCGRHLSGHQRDSFQVFANSLSEAVDLLRERHGGAGFVLQ